MTTGQSEKSLDTSNISAELLLLTLKASRAGLFYSPMSMGGENVLNFSHQHDPNQAWSLNIGPLFGLPESPKDSAELLPYIVEADQHVLVECVMKAIGERIRESDCEYRIRRPDNGETRWLMSRVLVGLNEQGETRYLASMCFDITEQKQEQENLQRANSQLEQAQNYLYSALSASGIGIFRYAVNENYNTDTQFSMPWNYNLEQIFGYPAGTQMTAELQIRRMKTEDRDAIATKARAAMSAKQHEFQHEYTIEWEDQSTHWLLSKCTTEVDENGLPTYVSGAVIDITDRRLAEEQLQFIATHDALTALPNRLMFSNLLSHTIETAKRYSNRFALFFIDLDRFKSINDALGHQAGDQLLVDTAQRLRRCLRTSDVLARISGDEFVLLAPQLDNEESAAVVARKIIAEVSEPMYLLEQKCQITASVGICLYPEHGGDEKTLVKNADSAMYAAKEAGKNNYQFFNSSSTSQSLERMALESELRSALANNEFSLQYQAKLDLRNNNITGVEALLRWNNPKYGSISPAQFIPMAEETGLIVPIGRWVLMTACKQNVEWQKQGLPPICVAVNISARQFLNRDLLINIKEALEESGMAPELLELEITESMVMHHVDQAVALLYEIKKLGARIAIDDFGTGYSSLAQLKRFPIDTLKVDRSFINEVAHDADDQAITDAVIALGKSLSLTIIAEGVETKEQQDFLRKHSCDEMQGYYFSRPVPPAEFSELLRTHSKTSSS
jgi:diguanylate cyclase (GGDEF)-like protein/PAS domain S-box-containing protein